MLPSAKKNGYCERGAGIFLCREAFCPKAYVCMPKEQKVFCEGKDQADQKIKRFFASEKTKPLKGFQGNGPLLHDGEQRRRESSRGIAIFWYGAMWP